jgi:hypothetical protein
MDAIVRDANDFWKKILRYLLICALAGIAINCVPYGLSLHRYLSHMSAYRDLHLGMSRSEAIGVLEKNNLACGSVYPPGLPPRSCQFWDFWRAYTVDFGPGSEGPLESKQYSYRRRSLSLTREVNWLRGSVR